MARMAAAFAALSLNADAAAPQPSTDPSGFITALRADVMEATSPGRPADQARAALDRLIADAFDLEAIADAVLRSAASATPEQRARLARALGRRMTLEMMRRRSGAEAGFRIAAVRSPGPDEWLVVTQVTPVGEQAIVVAWRVRRYAAGLRIVDVTRDGASAVIAQRDEIASALRARRGLDAVINDIERRNAAGADRP